jgi:hypothetical protein
MGRLAKSQTLQLSHAFWNQFILEPTSGLPSLFGTNFRGRWKTRFVASEAWISIRL